MSFCFCIVLLIYISAEAALSAIIPICDHQMSSTVFNMIRIFIQHKVRGVKNSIWNKACSSSAQCTQVSLDVLPPYYIVPHFQRFNLLLFPPQLDPSPSTDVLRKFVRAANIQSNMYIWKWTCCTLCKLILFSCGKILSFF